MKFTNALVVKLVDTKDLKSLPLAEVPVRVWPRAPLMSKLQIVSDKNKKSLKIKNLLLKKIKSYFFKKKILQ